MTYNEFIEKYNGMDRNEFLRLGQYMFNSLHYVHPNLAELVRTTDSDPFYLDSRLGAFYSFIEEHWDDIS